jgi:hypothetical protein
VTESEWLACENPKPMLEFLRTRGSARKVRLLGCEYCRLIWEQLKPEESRRCVETAEAFADGEVNAIELQAAYEAGEKAAAEKPGGLALLSIPAVAAWVAGPNFDAETVENIARDCRDDGDEITCWLTFEDGSVEVQSQPPKAWNELKVETRQHGLQQANYIRDIFGNPFHPVSADARWLTSPVLDLARTMYESRDFAAMPILADALEEAGCGNGDILAHCRGDGPHVRGCWVVDLVLGKA